MRTLKVKKDLLEETILMLSYGLKAPLYRGMSDSRKKEFLDTHCQIPLPGSLTTGTGVCFTDDWKHATTYGKDTLLITDMDLLGCAIDTRNPGHLEEAKKRMTGKYNGYDLWIELQKDNTITSDGQRITYTCRQTITENEILYFILSEDYK